MGLSFLGMLLTRFSGGCQGQLSRRLLKNAHLLRCAANLIARRISTIRLALRFLRALHPAIFEQPSAQGVLQ
jgi:hypothetical protein